MDIILGICKVSQNNMQKTTKCKTINERFCVVAFVCEFLEKQIRPLGIIYFDKKIANEHEIHSVYEFSTETYMKPYNSGNLRKRTFWVAAGSGTKKPILAGKNQICGGEALAGKNPS